MIKLNENKVLEAINNGDLEALKTMVMLQIEANTVGSSDSKRYNAFRKLAKNYKIKNKVTNIRLKGAFKSKNGNMTLCDGYHIIMLNNTELDNVEMIDNSVEALDVDKFFYISDDQKPLDINIKSVLSYLKDSKSKKEAMPIYKTDEIWFNAEYMKDVHDCLDMTLEDTTILITNKVNPIVIENKNGKAIVLPVRMTA